VTVEEDWDAPGMDLYDELAYSERYREALQRIAAMDDDAPSVYREIAQEALDADR
jgi:hypothetical protein